ncbi:MAG: hypothetical protein DMG58_36115 [Acidobacteria bacterium]|nr:MAG: hypothetical protein DMG58_36115 [Acidobacteriota bacterium]
MLARLKPGMTLASAQLEMHAAGERFRSTFPGLMGVGETDGVVNYHEFMVAGFRPALLVLAGAVGFVLLIACANVANLLLAQFTGRQHEMAVRRALGATLWTLIRQLLAESLLLAGAGAAAGLLLAASIVPLLMRLTPAALPQFATPSVDGRVILLAVLLALVVGALSTIAPAVSRAHAPVSDALRQAGTRTTEAAGSSRFRRALVIAEVSISFVMLAGAGLLGETFLRLSRVDPGFATRNVFTSQVSITNQRFAKSQAVADMTERAASRLEALPGVLAAGATDMLPMNSLYDLPFEIVGRPVDDTHTTDERIRTVSPRYFMALGVPIVAGRAFSARDTKASTPVLLVNQAFAEKYFPKSDPLREQILIGRVMGPRFADNPRQIVGVVGNTRDLGLGVPAPAEMFVPLAQVPDAVMDGNRKEIPLNWVVRTSGESGGLAVAMRHEMESATGLPAGEMMPLGGLVEDALSRQRFSMVLLGIFAVVALLLGSMGLYGVIAYSVAQRTREIGIRCAVGATPSDLVRLVLCDGMRLVLAGLGIGLAASLWLSNFLRALLYGVSPNDPVILAGVGLLLALTAVMACVLPARRAARIDPVLALRAE